MPSETSPQEAAEAAELLSRLLAGGAVDGSAGRRRAKDLVLPLDVTLEELFCGAVRQVALNARQLRRADYDISEDFFEVRVERGTPDGHQVKIPGKARSTKPDCNPGDVVFVLQERQHPRWRRKGLDLYTERTITLLEALTGYRLVIEQLDGRKLVVQSRPGEIVRPRNLLPSAEAEWERFNNTDAFARQDAGALKTNDLDACKEVCRQKGFSGFTYWEDTAYFRAQDRADLLVARKRSPGSTLFVCPDPSKSAALRMQRAVRGHGMPCLGSPQQRGNLFLLLKVELPTHVGAEAAALLREVLPGPTSHLPAPAGEEDGCDVEELELCDMDPVESQRRHHIATGGGGTPAAATTSADEAPPAGSPGPPPPCPTM